MGNNFSEALATTQSKEGEGIVQEPTGDISVGGFRQGFLDAYTKQKGIERIDVRELTQEQKFGIAKEEFFDKPKINRLPSEIGKVAFDFAFQSGPKDSIMALQKAVGAKADGIIGPNTLGKVRSFIKENGENALINTFTDERVSFLQGLNQKRPEEFNVLIKGLLNRAESFRVQE